MCVSMHSAEFEGAIAFGGEVNEELHLLGYQNSAKSYSGPNCMLLHVPTAELTANSLVPTESAPRFMEDMSNKIYELLTFRGISSRGMSEPIVVQYGAYEVVLAGSAKDVPSALERVSPAKRPAINDELLVWYDAHFPSFAFILACFNNEVEEANHPILVKYRPNNPEKLFVPGLESHSGRPPVLCGRDHPRDFKVVFGSKLSGDTGTSVSYHGSQTVEYRDDLGELRELLPTKVVGFQDNNVGVNADYWAFTQDIRNGLTLRDLFYTMPEHAADGIV